MSMASASNPRLNPLEPTLIPLKNSIKHLLRPLLKPLIERLGVKLNKSMRSRPVLQLHITTSPIRSESRARFLYLVDVVYYDRNMGTFAFFLYVQVGVTLLELLFSLFLLLFDFLVTFTTGVFFYDHDTVLKCYGILLFVLFVSLFF